MKRLALQVLVGSVVLSALLGIWALLHGEFGRFEYKVLLTSVSISGASILALACGAAWHGWRTWFFAPAGLVFTVAGFASLVFLMWMEARDRTASNCAISLIVLAVALSNAALLSRRRLPPSKGWLLLGAYASSAALVGLILALLWIDISSLTVARWIGVFSILLCAFTILIAAFQHIGRAVNEAAALPTTSSGVRLCPSCGADVDVKTDP